MKKSLFIVLAYSTLLTLSELAYRMVFNIPGSTQVKLRKHSR